MTDQASVLRQIARLRQEHQPQWTDGKARLIFIGSGKGGVGKSFLSLALAQKLVEQSARVLLVDANLANPSLHVMTNASVAAHQTVSHLLKSGRGGMLPELVELAPGFNLLPNEGRCDDAFAGGTDHAHFLLQLLHPYARVFDAIIVDSQTGLSSWNLTLIQNAHVVLLITIPEPTAIIDSYLYVKAAGMYVATNRFQLVVNQALHRKGGEETHEKLNAALDHFLGVRLPLAANLPFDLQVRTCLDQQAFPFLSQLGQALQAELEQLAGKMVGAGAETVENPKQGVAL